MTHVWQLERLPVSLSDEAGEASLRMTQGSVFSLKIHERKVGDYVRKGHGLVQYETTVRSVDEDR